mgnify:CR=1 FL=1
MKSTQNNLLIVEDNSFIREKLYNAANEIESIKNICLAKTLGEVNILSSKITFDLIILDLKLPDGNGIEFLKTMKDVENPTKILVFSASKELNKMCLKYGAFAFFDKAKDFDNLIETLKNI